MKNVIAFLLLSLAMVSNSHAATWVKLHDSKTSKLMLDKQSILQKDQLKRAWIKIEYKTPQKNLQNPEKEFNLSKVLWFFDCAAQKSATSQVLQYLNGELVYSAGIDSKNAEFIEPVPESDVDIAMRYVCFTNNTAPTPAKTTTPSAKPDDSAKKTEPKQEAVVAKTEPPATKPETSPATPAVKSTPAKSDAHKTHWSYEGKAGPENWSKLNPEFSMCDTGRNQSPINIETPIQASLKPLKVVQKFPAKDIFNNGHTVQVNFKEGNLLLLDGDIYRMQQVHFHAPGENKIQNKSYPLEAHFVHADKKGNLAVIGVMFREGTANPGLENLWSQMPNTAGEPVPLKNKVKANELMPQNLTYYRFNGSLTTPPCSEGVRWLLMKTPMTASKEQIEVFERAVHHPNNRPVQPLNGRVVVE